MGAPIILFDKHLDLFYFIIYVATAWTVACLTTVKRYINHQRSHHEH
jgi:hypothetical protein